MKNREIAGVKVFVSNEAYDEYKGTLQEQINKLQSNWNSLREYIEENGFYERQDIIDAICNPNEDKLIYIDDVLDKMNELEGKDKE